MAQIKDIQLGTKYVDRKNSKRIGEVIEVNEKTKTVTLKFEDGKQRPYVCTTLDKSFKILDDSAEPVKEDADNKVATAENAEPKKQEAVKSEKKPVVTPAEETVTKAEKKIEAEKAEKQAKTSEKSTKTKEKKEKKPKKEDKQVIETAIKAMDEVKATHKESWQNKGTAVYIGKIRVFECWKRMERMRINYNPELTSINAKLCVSVSEDYRKGSHLSATCYVQADKVAEAVKELINNINKKAVDEQNAKKAEKKAKKEEKPEKATADTKKATKEVVNKKK